MQNSKQKKRFTLVMIAPLLLALFLTGQPVTAAHLEPFKGVPVPKENPQTRAKIKLGKQLFFDRRLSGDGTMSCASCHNPDQAFTDGLDISLSYPTTRNWRNSPTLINVALQKFLFHDGRVQTLEDQALFPMMSAFEMNQNLNYVEEEIRAVPEYVRSFQKVFGGEVTRERIAMALASFQRTLYSKNAPIDRYLRGNKGALSNKAKKGFAVFTGKGKCTGCHHGVSLSDHRFYALHVPDNPALKDDPRVIATARFVAKVYHYEDYLNLREDPGRYLITKKKEDWKAFRTPTLREISRTAPYMHNGVFETLDEVIEFFNNGGGKGNRFLKPLKLTATEKEELKAFLVESLAGREIVMGPPKLP